MEEVRETQPAPAPKSGAKGGYFWGTGRRKSAIARVRIRPGKGEFVVNGKPADQYFCVPKDQHRIRQPMQSTETLKAIDVFVNAHGGGITGQADATVLGLARALKIYNSDFIPKLREGKFLRRDSRKVERKKYGRAGARRRFQFSKR